MQSLRASTLVGLFVLFLFLFAACGTTTASTDTTPTPTTQSTGYGSPATSTPTAATSSTPTASTSTADVVKTATATVQGKDETILTNAQGLTLYYFTADTATTSACTGGCTGSWPPLVVTGSGAPGSAASLPGKLTAVADASGQQVQYNGHFLYTFASDTAPGQTSGQGVGGKWFVVTPDLT